MKKVWPLMLVLLFALGCDRPGGSPPTVNQASAEASQTSSEDPSDDQGTMYNLPLDYDIDAPEVPDEIQGPAISTGTSWRRN